jgi:hypothetical protein
MFSATEKVGQVGRKKRPVPTRGTKLDTDLVSKAELLARNEGVSTGDYLSAILRPVIEREFAKLVRKASEGASE